MAKPSYTTLCQIHRAIFDKSAHQRVEGAGGMQWLGTEAGKGTLARADAQVLWLRYGTGQKVWGDQGYDLSKYAGARASPLALKDWLAGRARTLPPVDVPALLRKAALVRDKVVVSSGANPAKRKAGEQLVSEARGGAKRPALERPKAAAFNDRLARLEEEKKKILAEKKEAQREEDERRKKEKPKPPASAQRASRGRALAGAR